MSGGSYDYAYLKVVDMAESLSSKNNSPLRRAFGKHLKLVAKAMHDIEWVDSSDYGEGDDLEAITKVLENPKRAELEMVKEDAKNILEQLQKLLI